MQLLPIFFPRDRSPRTVVHAGPLLMKRPGGVRALRRFLRIPRQREVFLVHQGQESLHDVAKETGVTDISLESTAKQDANAATEMACALGARRLDFAIDDTGVSGRDGEPLREISVSEAESLARHPEVRPRIRAKLRAGCEALRQGMLRVRIGDPLALAKDEATVLVPDPTVLVEMQEETQEFSAPARVAAIGHAIEEPANPLRDPWWRLHGGRSGAAESGLRSASM